MQITFTQVLLTLFLIFALSRVVLRFKGGELSPVGFCFWSAVFGFAILVVIFPGLTSQIAQIIGIGRGADAIVYVSVTVLFYLVFRLYIYLEDIRHEITEIISKLALKELKKKNAKKISQD